MASDNDFRAALDNAARQAHDIIDRIHEEARAGLDSDYWVARTELEGKSKRVSFNSNLQEQMGWFAGQQAPMPRQHPSGYHQQPSGYHQQPSGYHQPVPRQQPSGYHQAVPHQQQPSGYYQQPSGYHQPVGAVPPGGYDSGYYQPVQGTGYARQPTHRQPQGYGPGGY